jgi:digeranylgeranylglycerophospholipid reductase
MKGSSDVIVIGGGPSGSFCALNMAKRDVNVTVFEEHSEIGFPCHCAGHLSINGLKNLGLYPLPRGIVESTFRGIKIYSPKGLEFSIQFASPITCAVNRALFDKYISQLAEEAGAHYFLGLKVEALIVEGKHVRGVVARRKGEVFEFFGKVIVNAEGTAYKILKQAGLSPPPRNSFVYCVNAEVKNVENIEPNIVEVFLGNAYTPGFYAWLIPKGEGKAKVGLGVKTGNPKAFLKKLMHKHPVASQKLRKATILQENFHPIPIDGPIKKAYSDGFLAVGDAASQVKPTTGGGVIFGLNCARIAAEVVADAVNSKNFSSNFLSAYQRRFTKLLGFDVKVMREARKMLNRVSDKRLDDLIGFCNKVRLEKSLQDLREIDFQGRTLLHTWRNPRIIAALVYFLLISFENGLSVR